ncbi:MAG TPA: hypothetical protein VKE25_09200 [Actinomycetes bacterium]|nr:hypothetical protein [Actinomycetes bacterium]
MTDPTGPTPNGTDATRLVGHCYTKARRFPLVIGKLPGGGRIPGGPYSLHQIGAMVVAAIVLKQTSPIWAHFGLLNLVVFVAVPYGLAFALRHARIDGRSPIWAAVGWLSYVSAPRGGRLRGRPLRQIKTRRQTGRFRFGQIPPDLRRAPARAMVAAPVRPQRCPPEPVLAPTGLTQLLDRTT